MATTLPRPEFSYDYGDDGFSQEDVRPAASALPTLFAYEATQGKYLVPPHIAMIEDAVIAAIAEGNGRLIITMPPRHGKSMYVSQYLPAWFLGSFPDRRVMLGSYEADFAASWGAKARDALAEYGPAIFGVTPRRTSFARGRWDLEGRTGGMFSAGVGGAFTGRGADLLIIDDPIKNAEDAHSESNRNKKWDWWQSTIYTRLEPGATVIVMATRWHEDDLIGRILADDDSEEPWTLLNLPAVAETDQDAIGRKVGEALWPERYSLERLRRLERRIGPYWFASLFQQRPAPVGGGLIKRAYFRRYEVLKARESWLVDGKRYDRAHLTVFGTMDVAGSKRTAADYTVLSTWGRTHDQKLLLLDRVKIRLESPDQPDLVAACYAKWRHAFVGVENVTFGTSLIQSLRRKGLPVRPLAADVDKITRFLPMAARYKTGDVYHPNLVDAQIEATQHEGELLPFDIVDFEDELLVFPNGAHDDQVDTAAYAGLALMAWPGSGPPEVEKEGDDMTGLDYGTADFF